MLQCQIMNIDSLWQKVIIKRLSNRFSLLLSARNLSCAPVRKPSHDMWPFLEQGLCASDVERDIWVTAVYVRPHASQQTRSSVVKVCIHSELSVGGCSNERHGRLTQGTSLNTSHYSSHCGTGNVNFLEKSSTLLIKHTDLSPLSARSVSMTKAAIGRVTRSVTADTLKHFFHSVFSVLLLGALDVM